MSGTGLTRRGAILAGLAASAAGALPPTTGMAAAQQPRRRGGQDTAGNGWRADLGNGRFMNPVIAGDHPDPSIVRDGDTYYLVASSFHYYPGLLIWRSTDLVNWSPVGPAVTRVVGSVYAPDLIKHQGRFYIYFAAVNEGATAGNARAYEARLPGVTNYVVHADSIEGPWSDPVDLGIRTIDPGHVVGEDGRRYLFLAGGSRIQLADDGLSTVGTPSRAYAGWPIPADWLVEGFYLEGPKLLRRGDYFYAVWAQGGTAGPPTSHMAVVARSRSVNGPWENSPHNPLVHTASRTEPWWSKGHATPVEGPRGEWWLIYHGYQNGFRTRGRQPLLEPMTWTADGWPRGAGGDLSRPLRMPAAAAAARGGASFSDDFSTNRLGTAYNVFMPAPDYLSQVRVEGGALHIAAQGTDPASSALVTWNAGDHRYMFTVQIEIDEGASAGMQLFYSRRAFAGIIASRRGLRAYKYGRQDAVENPRIVPGERFWLRVVNDADIATFFISTDGQAWTRLSAQDVSGLHHNIYGEFLSLRPAVTATGTGNVRVTRTDYRTL